MLLLSLFITAVKTAICGVGAGYIDDSCTKMAIVDAVPYTDDSCKDSFLCCWC
jgi:hypothetical protein